MWIAIGIILFLAVLITAVLLLPVYIIIKNDGESELKIRFRFLFKTFGDKQKSGPDSPILKMLKSAVGVNKLSVKTIKGGMKSGGFNETIGQTVRVLLSLLKEFGGLFEHCVCKKLYVHVISAGDDPGDAAINHGICCSFVYPLIAFLKSSLKRVSKRGEDIRLECDFSGGEDSFVYHLVFSVTVGRLALSLWHIILQEAKHQADNQIS